MQVLAVLGWAHRLWGDSGGSNYGAIPFSKTFAENGGSETRDSRGELSQWMFPRFCLLGWEIQDTFAAGSGPLQREKNDAEGG